MAPTDPNTAAPAPPPLAVSGSPPSVKTATFGDFERMVPSTEGARLVIDSHGSVVYVVDAKGQPISGVSISVRQLSTLAFALANRKVIRVTL